MPCLGDWQRNPSGDTTCDAVYCGAVVKAHQFFFVSGDTDPQITQLGVTPFEWKVKGKNSGFPPVNMDPRKPVEN